jgi:hypothetical protein
MTKQQFLDSVVAKKGFHSIIKDEIAPDHVAGDSIEKRFLYVNHTNADGTAGKTFVYYLHDKTNDEAWFYNSETESVDTKEPTTEQKKLDALQAYLKSTFDAFFVIRYDLANNWAEADVYTLNAGTLTASKVLVFKKGSNPISHLNVV